MPEISLKISPMNNPTVTVEGGWLVVRLADARRTVADVRVGQFTQRLLWDGEKLVLEDSGEAGQEEVRQLVTSGCWPPKSGYLVGIRVRGEGNVFRHYAGLVTMIDLQKGRLRVSPRGLFLDLPGKMTFAATPHPDGAASWQTEDGTAALVPLSVVNAREIVRIQAARAAAAGGTL
jgi:hypothetical protein